MIASAPAKLILCGEHAVVYQRPAIALPLSNLRAEATLTPAAPGSGLQFSTPDLGADWSVAAEPENPLSRLATLTLEQLELPAVDARITLHSAIPIASGMGSGAAIGTALVRVLAAYAGHALSADAVAALVYESERGYHGTPSGIDNTVVAHEQAIWFQRQPSGPPLITPIRIGAPLTLLVGDTGVRSATRLPVGMVRERREAEPERYEALFDAIGACVGQARTALAAGDLPALGAILNRNQELLVELGVSSPELDRLVAAARAAGALGAKLSGGGWGGVMLALVTPDTRDNVAAALRAAGATRVLDA
jgi:mevalonate kinase